MTKSTTRDAALSRLFGAEGEGEASKEHDSLQDDQGSPRVEASGAVVRSEADTPREQVEPTPKKRPRQSPKPERAPTEAAQSLEQEGEKGASGYIGLGRYAREDRILERITPYVRPDQAEALRVAVARKRDPRGRDISQIIQQLLDDAGYRGPGE